MIHNPKSYLGRSVVYIESRYACAAKVVSVEDDAERIAVAFQLKGDVTWLDEFYGDDDTDDKRTGAH